MRIGFAFTSLVLSFAGCASAQAADWYTGRSGSSAGSYAVGTAREAVADDNWIVAVDANVSGTSKGAIGLTPWGDPV